MRPMRKPIYLTKTVKLVNDIGVLYYIEEEDLKEKGEAMAKKKQVKKTAKKTAKKSAKKK